MDAALRDQYRVERELARGGMATVYLARDSRHDRMVALKVLKPALADSVGAERFLQEIRLTARLQHAHILPLLDSGILETAPGRSSPFYIMPYVEGESLRDRLARERQLPVEDAIRLAGDVAAALGYAHGRGVVHRDIKPENILLSNDQAIVVDFGIARAVSLAGGERLTETGLSLGTPHYMSPEQASGDRSVDARSDVYALGCVLYEMLAGEPPFTGPTAQAVVARSLVDPAPPIRNLRAAVSQEVERVIDRALAKVPADRFATATEFGDALSRAAVAPGVTRRSVARGRGRSLAVMALVLIAAMVGLLLRGGRAPRIITPASSIAVLPFTPSGTDTALSRLGRDLVFTLSAELDGLGGIRMVDAHTVLARAKPEGLTASSDGAALARRFGAGSIVQGSLVRVGADVRLDLALLGTDSAAAPLARVTVSAPPDSVAVLTDSAARALLLQIWSRGSPPTPSLDGALRTRSVPALRAFLQGEGEITHGEWEGAAVSYQRAMDDDPTFWLAHSRHVYARYWSVLEPADSMVALLDRHRFELPDRERLSRSSSRLATVSGSPSSGPAPRASATPTPGSAG
jgi:eukaryotic-like serine/threonine-protein kinase